MGEVIYWKERDTSEIVKDGDTGNEYVMPGDWFCEDERVNRFTLFGSMAASTEDPYMKCRGRLSFKDGSVWESNAIDILTEPDNCKEAHENIIAQAEEYLKSL